MSYTHIIDKEVDKGFVQEIIENTTAEERELLFKIYDTRPADMDMDRAEEICNRMLTLWFGKTDPMGPEESSDSIDEDEGEEWCDVYEVVRESQRLKHNVFEVVDKINEIIKAKGKYEVGYLKEVINAQAC